MRYCHSSSLPFHPSLGFGRDAASALPRRQKTLSLQTSRQYRGGSRLISPPHSTSTKQSGSSVSDEQPQSRVSGRQSSFELKEGATLQSFPGH
ncbi:unnamed protein product [Dicrocoelium dendriticum]|nr:unnamed protein product [Dicrocoelium dendriticum]